MTALSKLRRAALGYARKGWPVFPCEPHGKTPLTEHGLKDASTNEQTIRTWWTRWPNANIGHPTGEQIVLDVDGPEAEQALADLGVRHGPLPETLTARTGDGRHLYFASNGTRIRNSAGKLGPHLDIRGDGGYVILPPSIHPSGRPYQWEKRMKPALLPAWVAKLLVEPERKQACDSSAVEKIREGQRHLHLLRLAGVLRARGCGEATIRAALLAENGDRCEPPKPEGDVTALANDACARYRAGTPNGPGAQPEGFTLVPLRELLAKPDTPVDYVWDGLVVAGTVAGIFAKPKVGKGTLARNLCLAVARCEDFLGRKTKQGECIYLALEEREDDIKRDFRVMGADGTEPILIHAAAAPAEGIRVLCDLVRERKPRLVVIDPIIRLARIKDEKAYAETYFALGPLIDAARETGTLVLLLHHSGKSAKADPTDAPLGTTAIAGLCASLIVLKRRESYRTMQTVQRIGDEMPETVLQYDHDTKQLSIGGTREEAETASVGREILDFLQTVGEMKTEPEITERVEGKTKFVRRALRQLVEQGKVSRDGGGKRGDPYLYRFSLSCSPNMAGTREQETEEPADTLVKTEPNLVPASEQESFLVPTNAEPSKTHLPRGQDQPAPSVDPEPDAIEI